MANILLYGEFGWEITSKSTIEWLEEHKNEHVDMHINSIGGDVFEAIAIRSACKQHKDLTIHVDALAASAAAIVSLCGQPLVMAEYSRLMIHSASTGAWGNAKQIEEQLENLKGIDNDLAAMIADKFGKTQEEILEEYFDGNDHWLTAEECVNMGLATLAVKTEDRAATIYNCINGDKRTAILNVVSGAHEPHQANTNQNNTTMLEKLQAVALFKDCATEEAVIEKANQQEAEMAAQQQEIADKDAEIAELKAKLAEYEAEKEAAQKAADEAVISNALSEGKITAEQADIYRNLIEKDRENTVKMLDSLQPIQEPAKVTDHIKGAGVDAPKKGAFAEAMERIAKNK